MASGVAKPDDVSGVDRDSASILWFPNVGAGDINLVGGKGANLGEMTRHGVPVPPGFIVTVTSYRRFLVESGLVDLLHRILDGVNVHDTAVLAAAAERAQRTIARSPMSRSLAREITEAYEQLGGGLVAVRSSATAEDLPDASFAGQQRTYLNVQGADQVLETVRGCWASLFEARAIFYREEQHYDQLSVGIAVPVQRMVQSDIAGVMFTAEPTTSDRGKVLVEAVYGLGETIVSGEITPDSYLVNKESGKILDKKLVPQTWKLVRNTATTGSEDLNVSADVEAELSMSFKLSDAQLAEIVGLGAQLEQNYGHPQDVEWAFEGGKAYVVQTRPITTLGTSVGQSAGLDVDEDAYPLLLTGSPASPGSAMGPVKVVLDVGQLGIVEEGDILVTEMTTPDYVPAMKRARAIVTDQGGRTAHAAIISRELGIPCVVGTQTATQALQPGEMVTVDGSTGGVYRGAVPGAGQKSETDDGAEHLRTRTNIYVNLAEPDLADVVAERNVDGVGLLRAEFIVARMGEHPRLMVNEGRGAIFVDKLAEGLEKFAAAFDPRPVIYRTTDFKTNEYRNLRGGDEFEPEEENPMIGYRGAGRYVKEPDLFALEIDAVKRVRREHKNLHVMIPFVRTVDELKKTKTLMEQYGLRRGEDGFKLWMMAEIPSNVFLLDEFIDVGIDGVSIGSNDLTQLVLGVDRDSAILANDFDEQNPAVMKALETIVTTAKRRGVTCSICGQAPSFFPELTEKLVEWGITSISVSPDVINTTRRLVREKEEKRGITPPG
jgi:pyruvate,water dikinase